MQFLLAPVVSQTGWLSRSAVAAQPLMVGSAVIRLAAAAVVRKPRLATPSPGRAVYLVVWLSRLRGLPGVGLVVDSPSPQTPPPAAPPCPRLLMA